MTKNNDTTTKMTDNKNKAQKALHNAPKQPTIVYSVGDTLTVHGKRCIVVEILEPSRWHVKNLESPHDSFIVTDEDFNKGGSDE